MKTVAVVPIKMNNERTPGKNTKPFSDGTPLVHFAQKTLLSCRGIDEIYIYCSRDEIKDYILPKIKYLKRDASLDSPTTDIASILKAFANDVDADIYVLMHATAPFLSADSINSAITSVQSGECDSAFTVEKLQEFLWRDNAPINYSLEHIPRTQDLPLIWKETSGAYVYTREVIKEMGRRIGNRPRVIEVSKIEAIDIDNPEDFEIANAVYMQIISKAAASAMCTTGGGNSA